MSTATDFRDVTFADIKRSITGKRRAVYEALFVYGPCTTAHLAEIMDMSILTVRPRVTELCQMGLARPADIQPVRGQGNYEAVSYAEAQELHEKQQGRARQMALRLGA